MLHEQSPKRWTRRIGTGVGLATLLSAGVATAQALEPTKACQVYTTTQMYERWGDDADYFLIDEGDFESVTALPAGSWTIQKGNVSIVTDDAPIRRKPQSKVLQLTTAIDGSGLNAAAQSRYHCVLPNQQKMRFMARTNDPNAVLKGRIVFNDKGNKLEFVLSYQLNGTDYLKWKPGPTNFWITEEQFKQKTGKSLSNDYDVSVVFESLKGTWFVDDVAIDPFRSR
jgi:hypothetical protein